MDPHWAWYRICLSLADKEQPAGHIHVSGTDQWVALERGRGSRWRSTSARSCNVVLPPECIGRTMLIGRNGSDPGRITRRVVSRMTRRWHPRDRGRREHPVCHGLRLSGLRIRLPRAGSGDRVQHRSTETASDRPLTDGRIPRPSPERIVGAGGITTDRGPPKAGFRSGIVRAAP
jgi:hypothetical protein